jgi:poly[(R)-3-hydroxyalkanoate] polymerase subunit PhaC
MIVDRRTAPRPLAAHLASALMLWSSSRAVLGALEGAALQSTRLSERLRAIADEIDASGVNDVAAARELAVTRRAKLYLEGLEAYRRHPYRRGAEAAPALWREGATRLLDYGEDSAGRTILVVPSLINRFYILDLLPERSFLRHLGQRGLRPLVVDWGVPDEAERSFDLNDYVAGRLERAFDAAEGLADAPIGIVGYCMGGLFALALAVRRPERTRCLALLATPWDFHAGYVQSARFVGLIADCLPLLCDKAGSVPVDVIQSLFFLLDPLSAERKFTRFAALDPNGKEARAFVALEDWVNDGVPLAAAVARDCARSWYGANEPGRGVWQAGDRTVDPTRLRTPALVVVPSRDRIVPPGSADPLAAALSGATVVRPPLGHVGMMWTAIAQWLQARF